MKRRIEKSGQEEMVGFVFIVVIVSIILLVFLTISLRTGSKEETKKSSEIYQFLESSMEYTTDCAFSSAPDYYRLSELFEECYSGNKCLNEKESCKVLEDTLKGILDGSWDVSSQSQIKGYDFGAIYRGSSNSLAKEIIHVANGECLGSVRGSSYLIPSFPGKIEVSLKLCE